MVSVQRHVSLLRGALREAERERLWARVERLPHGHAGAVVLSDRRLLFSGSGFVQQSQEGWSLGGVGGTTAPAPAGDLPSGLERLADLHRSGALSDGEFERAKRRLLE